MALCYDAHASAPWKKNLQKTQNFRACGGQEKPIAALAGTSTPHLRSSMLVIDTLPCRPRECSPLRKLDLSFCDALTGMPDLSGLPRLQARRTKAGGMGGCSVGSEV